MKGKRLLFMASPITLILWDVGGVINDGKRFWEKRDDLAAEYHVDVRDLTAYSDVHRQEVDAGTLSECAFWHDALRFAGVSDDVLDAASPIGNVYTPPLDITFLSRPEALFDFVDMSTWPTYCDLVPYIVPIAGTIEVMEMIPPTVRQGILSNDSTELATFKRWQLYDHVVDGSLLFISADLGLIKPDATIYEEALRRSGMLGHPEQVLFIDDKAKNCVGAEAVGMQCLVFENPEQLKRDLTTRGIFPKP